MPTANPKTKEEGPSTAMERFDAEPQQADNVYRILITPDLAEFWLEHDTHNRVPAENVILQYGRDMKAGEWRETAEAIAWTGNMTGEWPYVEDDAIILNGGHRLRAAVRSKSPFPAYVAWEIPFEGQDRMDRGRKRTHGTQLQLRGEANATTLSALARRYYGWYVGGRRLYLNDISAQYNTDSELDKIIEDNQDLRLAASFAASNHVEGLQSSLVGLAWLLFNRIDPEDCAEFFRQLSKGFGLTADSPVYFLRERLNSFSDEVKKPREGYLFAHVVKAWNLFRDGTPASMLRIRLGGARPEAYPEPH